MALKQAALKIKIEIKIESDCKIAMLSGGGVGRGGAVMFLELQQILEMQTKINLVLSRAAIDMQSEIVWSVWPVWPAGWRIPPGVSLCMH